ncbi:MAG: zinc ribbon domain-containing protein, partial [Clostridia bacterium]|nr:zinc ribbon domain-containing protein [Clostridia bacterium]
MWIMYCQKCGNEVNENAAFCGSCGAKIEPLEEQ